MEPFKIHVADEELSLIEKKLELTRFGVDLEDIPGYEYGIPIEKIRDLHTYWVNKYNWRKQEEWLNSFPQFKKRVTVDGWDLGIHFIYAKSEDPNAIPLIFSHGWPGNVFEVVKLLPYLTNNSTQNFHVIAPSIPGYGFSDIPTKKGMSPATVAKIFNQLMLDLGYDSYVAQGGDWGSVITLYLGGYHSKHCKLIHTNVVYCPPPFPWKAPWKFFKLMITWYDKQERKDLWGAIPTMLQELGYMNEQMTYPTTLSHGLTDSPIGLLGWISEKLIKWSDSYPWTNDELITFTMLHWIPGPLGGLRLYKELIVGMEPRHYVKIPFGTSVFPKEPPADWIACQGNLQWIKKHTSGGHFAAWEKPKELSEDIIEFFPKFYKSKI